MSASASLMVEKSDDLLTEVLVRLPLRSIFKFKCVSSRWNHLISKPCFAKRYKSQQSQQQQQQQQQLLLHGFFQRPFILQCQGQKPPPPPFSFLMTIPPASSTAKRVSCLFRKNLVDNNHGLLLSTSPEGLILCVSSDDPMSYYVYNLMTNHKLKLPKPAMECVNVEVGLACFEEEEKNTSATASFKVIRANMAATSTTRNTLETEVFSSMTGKWERLSISSPSNHRLDMLWNGGYMSSITTADGVFFWMTSDLLIAAYDSKLGGNSMWLIRSPHGPNNNNNAAAHDAAAGGDSLMKHITVRSSDSLLHYALQEYELLDIWVLKNRLACYSYSNLVPDSEWTFVSRIEVWSFVSTRADLWLWASGLDWFSPVCMYPRMFCFHPLNAHLIYLRQGNSILCYDFTTRSLQRIHYEGVICPRHFYQIIPFCLPIWPFPLPSLPPPMNHNPFIHSFDD